MTEIIETYPDQCLGYAVKILGDKWTPKIVLALSKQVTKFCSIQRYVGGINPRTLSKKLDTLENAGIIGKRVATKSSTLPEYMLTERGNTLLPILNEMITWGDSNKEEIAEQK